MSTAKRLVTAAAAILLWVSIGSAQGQNPAGTTRSTISVTAAATADRVRFTAPSTVVQMRLEVYGVNGEKVFDKEIRGGNVIDWHLQDGQAERLSDGAYLCVVTVKSLSGKISQRVGSATIEKSIATLHTADALQLTPQQSEAVGAIEDDASLILLKEDEHQTTTVIAHNGEDGQITRGRGALSFRIGDFFRGKDIEQMRLTADGNLGIGVADPQAKLDVAGAIRASQGIIFPDGSIQFSAARKTFGAASRHGSQSQDLAQGEEPHPAISGTGTTGQIPKWLDGPGGALGDSVISELNGSIGINGAPNPIFKLDVNGHNRFRGSNVSFYLTGVKPGGNEWLFQTVDADGRLRIFDSTGGAERLSLTQSGNVGIGTPTPAAKLSVVASSTNSSYNTADFRAPNIGANISHIHWGTNGDWYIRSASNSGQVILQDQGGPVGIGTATPVAKLDIGVNGGHILLGDAGCGTGWSGIGFGSSLSGCTNYALLGNSTDTIISRRSGGSLDFREANTSQMTMRPGGNVGIGTTNPVARLGVSTNTANAGNNTALFEAPAIGPHASAIHYGTTGDWYIRSAATEGKVILQDTGGNVGIGTTSPAEKLSVAGTVQSTSGGFKFPDGSVQTTAANSTYTVAWSANGPMVTIPQVLTSVLHLDLPPGTYLLLATVEFVNNADVLGQNNSRNLVCTLGTATWEYPLYLPGNTDVTGSFHSVVTISSGVDLNCRGNAVGSDLLARSRRLTAVKIEGNLQSLP